MAGAARGLRRGGPRARRARRDRRPLLPGPGAADRLPLGPDRLAHRHRCLHGAVVPLGAPRRVGRHRGPRLRRARAEPQAGAGDRGRHPDRGRAARRDDGPGHQLVAVLQDHDQGRRPRQPRLRRHLGQRHPAPADGAGAVEARAGRAAVRHAVPADQGQLPRRRAHRGRRLGLGRRHRAVQGRHPHRRRRHRPADHGDRRRAQPRPGLPEPAGDPARQRRSRVPDRHRQEVRPDPLRAARLADARQRRLADPPRVVPVHRPGDRGGPRPPQAGRCVRDVQLLPRGVADRPAGRHRLRRLRPHAVRGHLRRRPGRRHGRPRPGQPAVRDGVPALRRR